MAECFAETVREMPAVVELYRLSGEIDYLLRVVVPESTPTTASTRS